MPGLPALALALGELGGTMAAIVWLLGSASVPWYTQRVGGYD